MRVVSMALLIALTGCSQWTRPAPPAAFYYCKPDSAVRYRSDTEPQSKMVRQAPPHGSCRHQ